MSTDLDLFRVTMAPNAGAALTELFTPDANGRIYVGQGPKVDEFEQALQQAIGLKRAPLGVNSCSAAIDLALHLIGVGPGDEVISTPITCTATNGSVVTRGARLVWADVDPNTGCIDPQSVARMVSPHTRAVVAVDWGGRGCDYHALRRASTSPIIQDAAHRLYVDEHNRGDFVCWSFGPIKHLTCGGYGGALLAPPAVADRARLLRWHGLDRLNKADFRCEQDITEVGYRYHLTDDQATVGLANLPLARWAIERARDNARWYSQTLSGVDGITVQPFDPDCDYWLYTLLADDRDGLKAYLAEQGIASSQVHARNDLHTAFRRATARQDGRLPGVEHFDDHQLSVPVGWWVTEQDRERVARAVIAFSTARTPVAA